MNQLKRLLPVSLHEQLTWRAISEQTDSWSMTVGDYDIVVRRNPDRVAYITRGSSLEVLDTLSIGVAPPWSLRLNELDGLGKVAHALSTDRERFVVTPYRFAEFQFLDLIVDGYGVDWGPTTIARARQ